jgi:23S rRNA (guanosine2251-2'-O)-methyltransferase
MLCHVAAPSPKDRFITVYGRKPVLEALADLDVSIDKVVVADNAHGTQIREIENAARRRHVSVQRATEQRVKVLAGNGRHDQGVFADVIAPHMRSLAVTLETADVLGDVLVLLDGITTPANVGMILRTATAAGVDGIVVPRRGVASLDPLVVKASAGVAFRAPILTAHTALDAAQDLVTAGYRLVGLAAGATQSVYAADLSDKVVLVLGGETEGISPAVADLLSLTVSIPMAADVESLNVAAAAAVVCFELARRRADHRD